MRWTYVLFLFLSFVVAGSLCGCAQGVDDLGLGAPAPEVQQRRSPAIETSGIFDGTPGAGVEFFAYPAQTAASNPGWGPVMTDVIQHLPSSYGNTYYDSDKITYCHEQSHGIHSHIRNNLNDTGERANGFYVPGDKAIAIVEPNLRKSAAGPYVPQSLRGSRFSLYITGQGAWDDTPLYIFDEWNSYVNGSACGVDLVQRGLWNAGWRDGVMGTIEFVVYSLALAMAVRDLDPVYFESNVRFREFLAYNLRRSMEVYRTGAAMEVFAWDRQDAYYLNLQTSPDAAEMRTFARDIFGEAWADSVLLGEGALPEDPDPDFEDDPNVNDDNDDDELDPDPEEPDDPEIEPRPDDPDVEDPNIDGDNDDDLDPPLGDGDEDGIQDGLDLCRQTPPGRRVWQQGDWLGCAGGEYRDRLPPTNGPDSDQDGIEDGLDLCSNTAQGALVWSRGEWIGCAGGQYRD